MRPWMLTFIMVGAVWAGTLSGKEDPMPDLKGKKVLIVIAATDFRDEEYFEPYNRLRQCGATVFGRARRRQVMGWSDLFKK